MEEDHTMAKKTRKLPEPKESSSEMQRIAIFQLDRQVNWWSFSC
jgi:hypothetical protein